MVVSEAAATGVRRILMKSPVKASASEAVVELRRMLDGHVADMDSIDQKAALIVPTLGAIGVLGAPAQPLGQASAGAQACLVIALASSLVSFVMVALTLGAVRFWGGADPSALAQGCTDSEAQFHQRLAGSLSKAVVSAQAAATDKKAWFNLSLFAAIIAVLAFAAARVLEG